MFVEHFNSLPDIISCCVNTNLLTSYLETHPNRILVHYVLHGIQYGFDIGFTGELIETRPKNLLSSIQNKLGVQHAIIKELDMGHTAGPFLTPPFELLHCSPIGAVVKKDNSCRIIMDLSQPKGSSINEGISKEEFSVQYTHFDSATDMVREAGIGCLLSKVDIQHAFRLLPVHPSNWSLLGYIWDGLYFVDTVLPFGLRSSPGIFNQFADLICWVMRYRFELWSLVHYSDDFLLVSSTNAELAGQDLNYYVQFLKI